MAYDPDHEVRMKRFIAIVVLAATALTIFYVVHEQLPRALRAPTSLLLSHVAIASGLLGLLGIDVYGNLALVFLVNVMAAAFVLAAVHSWRRHRASGSR